MVRYKQIDTSSRFIAVDLERQLLPGTLGHALDYPEAGLRDVPSTEMFAGCVVILMSWTPQDERDCLARHMALAKTRQAA
jgi:hypothetical protein